MHIVVCEGVFTESGHFVHIPETWRLFEVSGEGKHRAIEIWQDKVFELLPNEKKIDQETVAGKRTWRHSGFSVDTAQKKLIKSMRFGTGIPYATEAKLTNAVRQ